MYQVVKRFSFSFVRFFPQTLQHAQGHLHAIFPSSSYVETFQDLNPLLVQKTVQVVLYCVEKYMAAPKNDLFLKPEV